MSVLRSMNQVVAAPKEVAFVQEAITLHEEELKLFDSALEKKKAKLESISDRVTVLSYQNSYLKQVLELHEQDLLTHERVYFNLLNLRESLDGGGEGAEIKFLADLPTFPHQSTTKKEAISKIAARIREIQSELHAKLHIQPVWRRNVEGMELYRERILVTIQGLKAAFGPINKVPAEVWIVVFRHRIMADIEDYIESPGIRSYHSTAVTLGQVSSLWHDIVHTSKDLWTYFVCGPGQVRLGDQMERWKHASSFGYQNMTFICNLQAQPQSSSAREEPHAQEIMAATSHSIHLLNATNNKTIEAVKMLPFRNQSSLTLQMSESATVEFLKALSPFFPAFSHLKIVHVPDLGNLLPDFYARRTPPVEVLTLDIGNFTSFKIDYYCEESHVKEIHLIHNGVNSIIGRSETCPFLRVVGITPPDTTWLKNYELPALRRLILYGPKLHTIAAPSLVDLSQHSSFPNIEELEIRKWPVYEPADGESWNILPVILAIASRLRFIETIRCIDSFIEGKSMVSLVKLLKVMHGTSGPSKLKTVIIDCCSGITRDDCDSIAASVEKLVVYV